MKTKPNQKPSIKNNTNLDITKFTFLRDLLLVKAIRPESVSGLVDVAQYEDKAEFGVIVKVGINVSDIKVGDTIRFGKYSTENIRTNGQDYYIVHSEDVSAVMK